MSLLSSKELPKFSVKHFLHSSGHVAAKFQYDQIYTNSADAKILAALEYLGTFIEKKKVGCIWIDGGTPAASRQQLVTDFRYQGSCSMVVFLLSIKAGGVGLTLTAASTVIFTEQSWTPGDLIQAKDRAYRIGQVLLFLQSFAAWYSIDLTFIMH
nr:SWI/SNF-related matrix-associated actin-dependent regulator of chromatin subfamily A-like protein 1 homolog isoform X10 [Arachis hypogaea]